MTIPLHPVGMRVRAVKLERDGAKFTSKELWANRDASVIYNTPVIHDGLVFGLSESVPGACASG